jgi:hypothetical protein
MGVIPDDDTLAMIDERSRPAVREHLLDATAGLRPPASVSVPKRKPGRDRCSRARVLTDEA